MAAYISSHSLYNSLFNDIFCSWIVFINLQCYTGTFLAIVHWFGVPFLKLQTFSRIFWVLSIDYSLYKKGILGIFVYLFKCKVTMTKVNFRFYKQCSQAASRLICECAISAQNASIVS